VPVGVFPKLPEERSSLLFRAKVGGALILNCLGKGKERLRVGGKESFQAQHMRDYWSSLLSRSVLPKGSTGALEARGDLHSHSRATETMKEA
jgi:small ligand-binding sensory domain FIST